ncbi:MAG TPA: hypothetical protein VG148_19285 [Pyrinomonadaceae bacterium]|nr:hypothetical protein [Pyrinomonadaceae bacterium]
MEIAIVALALVLVAARLAWPRALGRRRGPGFGEADLVRAILKLGPRELDELFALYAREFGPGAARYARRTLRKWRSGEVRPNRQTFERILLRLPRVMSFDLKCEVLRRLREEYCGGDSYRLDVDTEGWREALEPLVEELIRKSYAAELPAPVARRLRWLADEDMRAARAILAESQARESREALSMLRGEFGSIEELLAAAGGRGRVTHTVRLPAGTITLRVRGGRN